MPFSIGSRDSSTIVPTSCFLWGLSSRPATTSPHLPDGQQRRQCAEVLRDQVRQALEGQAPWTPLQFPDARQLADWLEGFPYYAMRGIGIVDLSIIKAWERTCTLHPGRQVSIWSLDQHLTGYDRIP